MCHCCSVGRELIRGNWKGAVQLIMAGHEGEREDSAQARKLFLESDDVAGALKQMPRHQTVERAILEVSPSAPPVACMAVLESKPAAHDQGRLCGAAYWPPTWGAGQACSVWGACLPCEAGSMLCHVRLKRASHACH